MEIWQHPDLQRALVWLGLHWDTIASVALGVMAIITVGAIMRTRPLHHTHLREMPTYYKAENVVVGHVYNTWCDLKRQEFVVLAVRGDWFLIGVFPVQDPPTYTAYESHGWAGLLSSRQHITQEMLEQHHPDETRFVEGGWSPRAKFN